MATKTGKKYIICDVAVSDRGKSTFLAGIIKLMLNNPNFKVIAQNLHLVTEQWIVFEEVNTGETILIQTKGDDEESYDETRKYLLEHNVDIIVCARRTHGITADVVQYIAKKYHFTELDFTHMYPQDFNWALPAFVNIANPTLTQAIYNIIVSL